MKMARSLDVGAEKQCHIRRGALLHDIGKLGIPDVILRKPGPLSDEEWTEMRKHPSHALEVLEPIVFLRPALEIPYAHHERWDGTGYPGGLKGEQIPLAARAFTVVDAYDALTHNRPYRAAWSADKALDYIDGLAGVHFDPDMVDTLHRVLGPSD
jgi:HD-GYP domain-containing protein (c-di-GMP phosphodiesterase class II)